VLLSLTESKTLQEKIASNIAKTTQDPILGQLAQALSNSNRIMAEDLLRESGYMLPQSQNTKDLLSSLLNEKQPEDFPEATVKRLLQLLNKN
jgi:hypothetical protein